VFAPYIAKFKSERIASIITVLEKGEEKMEEEMDIAHMITTLRQLESQLDVLKTHA